MNVSDLLVTLRQEKALRVYIRRVDLLEQTQSLLKALLRIAPELFIQVYRNDQFDTLNLVLIYNGQRLYGRDRLGGVWHRHDITAPDQHDKSPEGQRPLTLPEFLDEVETILAEKGLP